MLEWLTLRRVDVGRIRSAAPDPQVAASSFNGRTVGSEPINRGSNPWEATKSIRSVLRSGAVTRCDPSDLSH